MIVKSADGVIFANESLNIFGVLAITIAVSIGYVSLANALSSVQPLFVLLFAIKTTSYLKSFLLTGLGK